jgi:hypothetical protein
VAHYHGLEGEVLVAMTKAEEAEEHWTSHWASLAEGVAVTCALDYAAVLHFSMGAEVEQSHEQVLEGQLFFGQYMVEGPQTESHSPQARNRLVFWAGVGEAEVRG